MEKDVVISIRGMQWYENRESDSIELVTRGVMLRDGVVCTLSYQESKLTGMEGTLTTIQVEGEQVSMLRVGEYNTQMVFQTGRRHLSVYNTPYGAMEVGVNTRHLLAELKEDSGIIEVDYDIEVDHALAGRNAVQIEIAPVEGASLKRQERDSV
ncbi:DUF1934 domain-containing protein [Oscillospiraceae bacterium 50-16]|jgi:uncharacterized beta-barrel protein YwiB (DUF1934 family)|nr:DUF1934 domain-containing protein [Lawsonibacter sp.]